MSSELQAQATELKQARKKTAEELHKLSEENRANIQSYKSLLAQAAETKRRRDTVNAEVKELFDKRRILVEQAKKLEEELKAVELQIAKTPHETKYPAGVLRKMMNELEWRLQTEALNPRQEKALSQEVQKIKKELEKAEKVEPLFRQSRELRRRKHEFSLEFRALDESIESLKKEGVEAHEKTTSLYKKADAVKEKISEYLDLIGEKSKEAGEIRERLDGTQEEIEREEARKRREQEQRKKAEDSRKQLSINERARLIAQDFKSGKKISLEDLQVLQASGIEI